MAQILLIGSLGLGTAGALSAEENKTVGVSEISVHQSEVDRVLSSPISGNMNLDLEESFVTKKNRTSLFSKRKTSEKKRQEFFSPSFSKLDFESLNLASQACFPFSPTGSHFGRNFFLSLTLEVPSFHSVSNLDGAASSSSSKNRSWDKNENAAWTGIDCFLFAPLLSAEKNFCSSEEFLFHSVTKGLWLDQNFTPIAGFDPGERMGKVTSNFLFERSEYGRKVWVRGTSGSAEGLGRENGMGCPVASSLMEMEKNPGFSLANNLLLKTENVRENSLIPKRTLSSEGNVGTPQIVGAHSSNKQQFSFFTFKNSSSHSLVG
ncbi:hypothetical protein JWG45_12765 [Leptospira sp. 201903070]|uniref:Porin n=1 Tax=Leptospira ainlahdjerensis TaxID=2810033 RepID=A0ABS2UCB6_9LEPT|nr:hypothetical protein [Leptospira ainlahdjerensis]MBM9578021.1 hypothetical protein [Leptospira ainlahdjerensis]